jgi:DNA-binding beta-propeller fold protein YncE
MMRRCSLTLLLLLIIIPVFLLTAGSGRAGDVDSIKNFQLQATIQIPLADTATNPLQVFRFFDISWVDEPTERYFIADRSNAGVDIIHAETNTWVHRIGGFAGQKFTATGAADNAHSGPDGVLVIHSANQLWAGDGDSTVKVFDLATNGHVATISTCGPPGGPRGEDPVKCARADEMAHAPEDHVVAAANNAADPTPFVTLISTETYTVLARITFDSALAKSLGHTSFFDSTGAPGGIEQPVWDLATRRFYISVPTIDGSDTMGAIAVINPRTMSVERLFEVDDCNPAGLTLGPHQNLLVGCGLSNAQSVIMDARDGHIVKRIFGVGGSDEVWFNRGDGNYYLAARNNVDASGKLAPALGIIDAATNTLLGTVSTGPTNGNHSVAADRKNNHVFVPLRDTTFTGSLPCAKGCIGVYWSDEDEDEK